MTITTEGTAEASQSRLASQNRLARTQTRHLDTAGQ